MCSKILKTVTTIQGEPDVRRRPLHILQLLDGAVRSYLLRLVRPRGAGDRRTVESAHDGGRLAAEEGRHPGNPLLRPAGGAQRLFIPIHRPIHAGGLHRSRRDTGAQISPGLEHDARCRQSALRARAKLTVPRRLPRP